MLVILLLLAGFVGVLAAWLFVPYFAWREVLGHPVEDQVARTSFEHKPGELLQTAKTAPGVALSVVVPAYNEELRLPKMLDEALQYLEGRATSGGGKAFTYEIVVVDDGSADGTYEAAVAAGQAPVNGGAKRRGGELRVVRLGRNRGKGFAVKVGMLVARGETLLMADADGATSIKDLERLEQALLQNKGAKQPGPIAFGSRHHLMEEALVQRSMLRNLLMVGFHFVVWCLVGGPIHDTQCGFKLFRRDVAKQIFTSLHLYRWAFDIEVVILARMLGHGVAEVPVTFVDMPGSKLNLVTGALSMLRDIVLVRLLYLSGVWRPGADS